MRSSKLRWCHIDSAGQIRVIKTIGIRCCNIRILLKVCWRYRINATLHSIRWDTSQIRHLLSCNTQTANLIGNLLV
jgi:hypothetical protein